MKALALIMLGAVSFALGGCKPPAPPANPFPTKENTIDKVKADIDNAMKKAEALRNAADPTDEPTKKVD
ncbi:MAG: hypothetical protein ABIZ64_01900 [Casimicrobium sp.]